MKKTIALIAALCCGVLVGLVILMFLPDSAFQDGAFQDGPTPLLIEHENLNVVVQPSNVNTIRMGRSDLQVPDPTNPDATPRQVERWVVIVELIEGEPIRLIFIGEENPELQATQLFTKLTKDIYKLDPKD